MTVSLPLKKHVRFYTSNGFPFIFFVFNFFKLFNRRDADLLKWNHLEHIDFGNVGETHGMWECPSLQQIDVLNSKSPLKKYVFVVSFNLGEILTRGDGVQYFVGDFDLQKGFQIEQDSAKKVQLLDYGHDFYATTVCISLFVLVVVKNLNAYISFFTVL